mgnify:FL=1
MNGDPSNKKNQFIYTLFYSVLVVLTAQINVHPFPRNFVASAGVIVFALLMLLLDEFAAMPVMFLSATGVMVTRSIAGAGKVLTAAEIWKTGMPEFVFYIVFGVVIYLLYNYVYSEGRSWTLFIVLFVPDFAANLAELYIRIGSEVGNASTIFALLLIAFVRTAIILAIYRVILRYGIRITRMPRSGVEVVDGKAYKVNASAGEADESMSDAAETARALYNKLSASKAPSELTERAQALAEELENIWRK